MRKRDHSTIWKEITKKNYGSTKPIVHETLQYIQFGLAIEKKKKKKKERIRVIQKLICGFEIELLLSALSLSLIIPLSPFVFLTLLHSPCLYLYFSKYLYLPISFAHCSLAHSLSIYLPIIFYFYFYLFLSINNVSSLYFYFHLKE